MRLTSAAAIPASAMKRRMASICASVTARSRSSSGSLCARAGSAISAWRSFPQIVRVGEGAARSRLHDRVAVGLDDGDVDAVHRCAADDADGFDDGAMRHRFSGPPGLAATIAQRVMPVQSGMILDHDRSAAMAYKSPAASKGEKTNGQVSTALRPRRRFHGGGDGLRLGSGSRDRSGSQPDRASTRISSPPSRASWW